MTRRRVIWKYPLPGHCGAHQLVRMPAGAIVRKVAAQDHIPTVWVEVDPNAPVEPRTFVAVMTGVAFDVADLEYLDTILLDGGGFVIHVYEVKAHGRS